MALHERLQTLLVRAVLVAACGFLLLVARIASEPTTFHTNAPYNKNVHGKPVAKCVKLNTFVHKYAGDKKLFLNKILSVENGTLGCIPVRKCEEDYNPCPFGPDGNRLMLKARKVKQTVIMYFNNADKETYTYEVDGECICVK